jgi:hypothetical protein
MNKVADKLEWTISVPILRNSIILKQLGKAIGIPFGILIIFLIIWKATYALILIGALFLLTYLFIRIIWGGKYKVGFELDKTGIRNFTMGKQAKQNRVVNILTIIAGLLTGKFSAAGAGFLAHSKQDVFIMWRNIKKVKYHPVHNTVMLRGGLTENMAVFCTAENYADVETYIRSSVPVNISETHKKP